MRAAVMHDREDIRIEDTDAPALQPGELLLEVHAAGICGTDVGEYAHGPSMFPIFERHRVTGQLGPMIPGHEIGGRVVAVGDGVEGFAEGDLVASGAGVSCGVCFQCRANRTNLCVDYWTVGLQRHGALAQYVSVPASVCLNVTEVGLTDDAAAMVQPMSIAVHAMRRGGPEPGEAVCLIGVGGIGAFLTYALAQAGVDVVAADLDSGRLALASELGAAAGVPVTTDTPLAGALAVEVPHPRIVYEVTGTEPGLQAALDLVAPGGTVVAVGLQKAPRSLDVLAVSLQEKTIVGTNAHVFGSDFADAAHLMASRTAGWQDVAPVALPLDQLVDVAIADMRRSPSPRIKTLLDPWADAPRPTETKPQSSSRR